MRVAAQEGGGVAIDVGHTQCAVALGVIPRRLAFLTDSGIALQIPLIDWQALAIHVVHRGVAGVAVDLEAFFERWSQLHDAVLIESGVEINIPGEIGGVDNRAVELNFHALVHHVADVVVGAVVARAVRSNHKAKHVGGLLVEVFHTTAQAAAEQLKLDACIHVVVGFPSDVFVTLVGEHQTKLVVAVDNIVGVDIAVVADFVVTLLAKRCLELEQVEPTAGVVHKRFLRNNPGTANRVEVTPAVVGVETARSIATIRDVGEIALCIVILAAEEETFGVIVAHGIAGVAHLNGARKRLVEEIVSHILPCTRQILVALLVVFVTQKQLDVVVAKFALIVDELLEVVGIGLRAVFCDSTVRGVVLPIAVERVGSFQTLGEAVRHRSVHGHLQALHLLGRDVGITVNRECVLFELVHVQAVVLQRVDVRQHRASQPDFVAIAVVVHHAVFVAHDVAGTIADVSGIDRRHVVHLIEHAAIVAWHGVILAVSEVDVCANLHPVLQAVVRLDASRIAVVVAVVNSTLVVEVAQRAIELQTVVTAGDVEVILLAHAVAESQLLPVVGRDGVEVAIVVYTSSK